jgi:hypothetical protein
MTMKKMKNNRKIIMHSGKTKVTLCPMKNEVQR